jgi:hypothetical protein
MMKCAPLIAIWVALSTSVGQAADRVAPKCVEGSLSDHWHWATANDDDEFELLLVSLDPGTDDPMKAKLFGVTGMDTCGTSGCQFMIYRRWDDKCVESVGYLFGHVAVLRSKHAGLPDLKVTSKSGWKTATEVYQFNAKENEYVVAKKRK